MTIGSVGSAGRIAPANDVAGGSRPRIQAGSAAIFRAKVPTLPGTRGRSRENREGGEAPPRAQRCDGDCPDDTPLALALGRRPDGMILSQKTGPEAMGPRRGRAAARALPC